MRVELRKNTRYHQCRVEFDDSDDSGDDSIVECVAWNPGQSIWICTCTADPGTVVRDVVRLPHCVHFQLLGITSTVSTNPMRVRARAIRLQEQGDFDAEAMLDARGDEVSRRNNESDK